MLNASDHGLTAWSFDPALCDGQSAPADAEIYLIGVRLRFTTTVTNVHCFVGVAGSELTASFAGLYTSAGVRVGVTASITGALESTGLKTLPLTAPIIDAPPGWYYVALLSGGGDPDCQLNHAGAPTVSALNAGITDVSRLRFGTHNAGSQSTLPATVTPEAAGAVPFWAGIS